VSKTKTLTLRGQVGRDKENLKVLSFKALFLIGV
jgi:hypothetical protein